VRHASCQSYTYSYNSLAQTSFLESLLYKTATQVDKPKARSQRTYKNPQLIKVTNNRLLYKHNNNMLYTALPLLQIILNACKMVSGLHQLAVVVLVLQLFPNIE